MTYQKVEEIIIYWQIWKDDVDRIGEGRWLKKPWNYEPIG